jgi:general secretion pathway protein H
MAAIRASTFRGRPSRGFTLIEMLVVVLIISLLVGLVSVITRPDARGLLRLEAERLAQLMDFAVTEANLTGKTIGWTADGPGYRFWRQGEEGGWTEIRDSDVLRERTLPPGMTISDLRVENTRSQGVMRLAFPPYAPPFLFTIELALGPEHYIVAASPSGSVRAAAFEGQIYGAPAL